MTILNVLMLASGPICVNFFATTKQGQLAAAAIEAHLLDPDIVSKLLIMFSISFLFNWPV